MELFFKFLCGLLYLIGYPFGLSYQETSIVVCIYMWPMLCTASTIPILWYSIKNILRCKNKVLWSIVSATSLAYMLYYVYYTCFFIKHYGFGIENAFNIVVEDLTDIAERLGMTYAEINIYIYVVAFAVTIGINTLLAIVIKKVGKKHVENKKNTQPV